jgi:hypothetical protein
MRSKGRCVCCQTIRPALCAPHVRNLDLSLLAPLVHLLCQSGSETYCAPPSIVTGYPLPSQDGSWPGLAALTLNRRPSPSQTLQTHVRQLPRLVSAPLLLYHTHGKTIAVASSPREEGPHSQALVLSCSYLPGGNTDPHVQSYVDREQLQRPDAPSGELRDCQPSFGHGRLQERRASFYSLRGYDCSSR